MMKIRVCITLFFVAMCYGAPSHAGHPRATSSAIAEDDPETTLQALEKQRAEAIVRRDIAVLGKLMDRYYRHVESRGRVRSKVDLLTALERGDFRFQMYENESTEIQVLDGGKTAVIAGVFRSRQAARKVFRGRYVRIWVHEADGWKNTFHQATEIRVAADGSVCN